MSDIDAEGLRDMYENRLDDLRESLRLKTEALAAVIQDNEYAMGKLKSDLASSKAHHAYDCARKDAVLSRINNPGCGCSEKCRCLEPLALAAFRGWARGVAGEALAPSTPVEAEAWAREQEDGKEK